MGGYLQRTSFFCLSVTGILHLYQSRLHTFFVYPNTRKDTVHTHLHRGGPRTGTGIGMSQNVTFVKEKVPRPSHLYLGSEYFILLFPHRTLKDRPSRRSMSNIKVPPRHEVCIILEVLMNSLFSCFHFSSFPPVYLLSRTG